MSIRWDVTWISALVTGNLLCKITVGSSNNHIFTDNDSSTKVKAPTCLHGSLKSHVIADDIYTISSESGSPIHIQSNIMYIRNTCEFKHHFSHQEALFDGMWMVKMMTVFKEFLKVYT